MTRTDIPIFAAQLNALAEVFGKPAVSVKAMDVWFDALKEFPMPTVMDVVNGWAKANARFPTPQQVWGEVNEREIRQREKRNAFERAQNTSPKVEFLGPTEEGKRICALIRAKLGTKAPPVAKERVPGEDDERATA